MTDKPIPSAEAVEAAGRDIQARKVAAGREVQSWDELAPIVQHNIREALLPILTSAYPQIVADVLNHYAEQAEELAGLMGTGSTAEAAGRWLRTQAAKVQA